MKRTLPPMLTEPRARALRALADLCNAPHGTEQVPRNYASPASVARALWPDSPGWDNRSRRGSTYAQGAMGATMPMKAATLLWRLEAMGLTRHEHQRVGAQWTVTQKGREWLSGSPERGRYPA